MKLQLSIATKLTLFFVLFAAVLLLSVGVLAYTNGRNALETAITAGLLSTALEKEASLNAWVEEREAGLITLTTLPMLHQIMVTFFTSKEPASVKLAHDRLMQELQSRVGSERQYLSFLVLDPETGQVTVATNPEEEGQFKTEQPFFINGRQGSYVQNVYYEPASQEPAMMIATPFYSAEGQLLAVLVAQLNQAKLEAIISRRTGLYQTDDIYLVNTSNQFLAQPRFVSDSAILRDGVHTEAVNRCLTGESGVISAEDYRQIPAIIVYRWLPERQLCLIAKIDQAEALAPSRAFGQTIVLIGTLALLLASLLAMGLSRTITKPVLGLQMGAARFGRGELEVRLPETSGDELGRLAREFNTMAMALSEKEVQLRHHSDELEQIVEQRTGALRLSEERFAKAFRASPAALSITRLADGYFVDVNESFQHLFGYSREELIGHRSIELNMFPNPDERAEPVRLLREQGSVRNYEMTMRAKSGELHSVLFSTEIIELEGEAHALAILFDITERERAEAALRESEERFRATFEQAAVGLAHVDPVGRWLRVNQKLCEIVGYTREELLKKTFQEITHPEDLETDLAHVHQILVGDIPTYSTEQRYVRKDGSIVWIDLTVSLVRELSGEPKYFISVIEDISQRKNLEEQFRQAQKMEAIGRLSGSIAHDFNNLLVVINGYSELLLDDHLTEDGPSRRHIEEIAHAGERAAALTRQLLAFSRQQMLQPQMLNLNELVANLENMLRRLIGEDIELIIGSSQKVGPIKADLGQLEQVIMNLVINARDAMPQGGKLIIETANVELDAMYASQHLNVTPGSYVMLIVSDTGIGMDAQTRSRIFEPFFTLKEKGKGTGLGLASVYGIIKQSGGDIWAYSEPGRGTTFRIYLPRVEETIPAPEPQPRLSNSPPGEETILLVEDEEGVRNLAHQSLERGGYTVLVASQGAEALWLNERQRETIHLLVTDVVMPGGMNGQELAEQLKVLRPGLKVLFMSGYTDEAIVHHGVLEPGLFLLQKPFTPNMLLQKVREVLEAV